MSRQIQKRGDRRDNRKQSELGSKGVENVGEASAKGRVA